ncbi:MAG: class I SAM-dependent methyltransferase [Bacteroidales bacterium]|nr:class I SAM-dependent methyltransferase [Bacteroidales bacterium]
MKRTGVSLLVIVLLSASLPAQRNDPFQGITDEKVLPMLKHLPYRHGGMNVPAEDGRLLYDIILDKRYKRGLEIGTSNGYSALWLGMAFKKTGGNLITLEIEPQRAKEAQDNFRHAGLDDIIESRINDALKEIPALEGKFDFVFIDAWKPDYMKYLELILPKMKPGGVITAHNVTSQGSSMRDFLDEIQQNPKFRTTIDRSSRAGVSISYVK